MFRCEVRESGDKVTLHLVGRLDRYAGVDRILVTIEPYLTDDGVEEVILDLTDVEDLNEQATSALPGLKLEARARGKKLSVVGPAEGEQTKRTEGLSRRLRR